MESASKVDTKRERPHRGNTNSHRLRPILCPHWASQKSQGPLIASCSLSCSVQTWMCRSCRPPRGATWRTGGLPGHSARPPHLTQICLAQIVDFETFCHAKIETPLFCFRREARRSCLRERGTLTVASQRGAWPGQESSFTGHRSSRWTSITLRQRGCSACTSIYDQIVANCL